MSPAFDWPAQPEPWRTLGPEIAAELRRVIGGPQPDYASSPRGPLPGEDLAAAVLEPIREIQRAVCRAYKVPMHNLLGDGQERDFVIPRQLAMYLACKLTGKTRAVIGRCFNRDYSTVWHACRVVASNEELRPIISHLTAELQK